MQLPRRGLTILAAGLLVSAVYFYAGRRDSPKLVYQESLRMLQNAAVAKPPSGYREDDIRTLFQKTLRLMNSDSLGQAQERDLNSQISGILKDNRLDSLEILVLLQTLERITDRN